VLERHAGDAAEQWWPGSTQAACAHHDRCGTDPVSLSQDRLRNLVARGNDKRLGVAAGVARACDALRGSRIRVLLAGRVSAPVRASTDEKGSHTVSTVARPSPPRRGARRIAS
jgi:hypothetical protein